MTDRDDIPKLSTLKGRLRAIQREYREAMVSLDGERRSKEARNWIKLAHEITERRDLEKEVQKLLAAMERDRVAAERGQVVAEEDSGEGEEADLQ